MKNIFAAITGLFRRSPRADKTSQKSAGCGFYDPTAETEETVLDIVRRMGTDDPDPGEFHRKPTPDEIARRFQ